MVVTDQAEAEVNPAEDTDLQLHIFLWGEQAEREGKTA